MFNTNNNNIAPGIDFKLQHQQQQQKQHQQQHPQHPQHINQHPQQHTAQQQQQPPPPHLHQQQQHPHQHNSHQHQGPPPQLHPSNQPPPPVGKPAHPSPFIQQHYEHYQKCAADYKSRQEKLRQDGMYILTIKNHRQYMNSSKSAAEHISEFTNIDLSQNPNVIVDARARHNNADMRDFTILFLFKLTDPELAQRIMAQRVDKLKQIGSFNVQLAFEDRMAEKKLKKLKASGVIAGYGQNRYGMMYSELKKYF